MSPTPIVLEALSLSLATETSNCPQTFMDPTILNLAIRWVAAVDAFSASCVSQGWRQLLSAEQDNGNLWLQVCQNSVSSEIPSLESSLDYRRLAMGLRMRDIKPITTPYTHTIAPTMRREDFFAVMDLYRRHQDENGKRRKEMFGSHICLINASGFGKIFDSTEPIVKGPNPFAANMSERDEFRMWRETLGRADRNDSSPLAYASRRAAGGSWGAMFRIDRATALRVDVTLFRRDNAKSVCLIHDAPLTKCDYEPRAERLHIDTELDSLDLAQSDAGSKARSLLGERTGVMVDAFIKLAPVNLPARDADDEPLWLKHSRQAVLRRRIYQPNEEDLASLANTDYFHFYLNEVRSRMFHLVICRFAT